MGECVGHEPCPACGSRDNLARYADGSAHCFGCLHHIPPGGDIQGRGEGRTQSRSFTAVQGHYEDLRKRGIDEETCKKAGYQIGERDDGGGSGTTERVHIMNWRSLDGQLISQKFRTKDKEFSWIGETKEVPLYLQWLWPSKGRSITITEGELDALSVLQAWDLKWPVVSLPNGCGSTKKSLARSYEWLDGFDKIVLMFDQDEAGQKAVAEAVELLPAGKVYIAKLPRKDANEVLLKDGPGAIIKAFWDATLYRPDGIVAGSELTRERLKKAVTPGYAFPYPKLQAKTFGMRKGELTLLTAGSGIGKSTWARELAYYLHQTHGLAIGNIFLEETNDKTGQAYVALDNNVPLCNLQADPNILSDDRWDRSLENVVHTRMWFYDHFGSLAADNLIKRITYLARVCKVDFVILDHISIVTSGVESSSEGERKDIDILMTRLAQLVQETGIGIIAIVHLKRKPGQSFNEGAQVSLNDLRGSGSLEQLSFNVYALERDQQAENADDACRELIRVLKCRQTGDTGEADEIIYDRKTGRLVLATEKTFATADLDSTEVTEVF